MTDFDFATEDLTVESLEAVQAPGSVSITIKIKW
jgi:hypothetical protein